MKHRPNVVIILADDLGWGDLGCYGAERIPTPRLDRLAAEGLRATDAHASSAVCTPSRYGLLTGRYAWRSPLRSGVLGPHGPAIIEGDRPTLASVLRGAGYATGAFGKWHLGLGWRHRDGQIIDAFDPDSIAEWEWDPFRSSGDTGEDIDYTRPFEAGPTTLGFDRFFGIAGSLDMPPYCFLEGDRPVLVPDRLKTEYAPGQRPGYTVEGWRDDEVDLVTTGEALGWMRENADRPFFLYLATTAPHRPCVPPERFRGASEAGLRGDSVVLVDSVVGEVLDALDQLGIADDTIVVFTSDNGATLRFPEDGDARHRPNGDWRGQKADAWEGGHREPFILRWPGRIPAGAVVDDVFCLTDLLPTIASWVGADVPDGAAEDGVDLSDLLSVDAAKPVERVLVSQSGEGAFAVRAGNYKALFTTGSGGFTEPIGSVAYPPEAGQLYNLADDPQESVNLWDGEPQVVERLFMELIRIVGPADPGIPVR